MIDGGTGSLFDAGVDLLVVAKAPVPGRVKTRLCPPCTPGQAARIAEASLAATLRSALDSSADRVLLALDGPVGPWCPPTVRVVDQGAGELSSRLVAAWSHAGPGPVLQIGMDTPHVGSRRLDDAMAALLEPGVDAVLGPARDGGWWAIGLRDPRLATAVFPGVVPSREDTGARQRDRLDSLGLAVVDLWVERDLDTWDDVVAVFGDRPARQDFLRFDEQRLLSLFGRDPRSYRHGDQNPERGARPWRSGNV